MMQTLLEVCTCRGTRLGEFLGKPQGRTKLNENWQVMPVRYCLNPEYIFQTIDILKCIKNKTFGTLAQKPLPSIYTESITYTENIEISAYIIEISSLKYKDSSSPSGWNQYTYMAFQQKLEEIKSLCNGKDIIWLAPANVEFTREHMNIFNTKNMFTDNRLTSRLLIDNWLRELSDRVIFPSEILSGKYAENVFQKQRDLTHYNNEIELYVREQITNKLNTFLS